MSSTSPTTTPAIRPQGRRAQNKADKRARILEAAREQLREVGFDAMTTARVAQLAGVASGTVFQYAATKPELLMMVVANEWREWIAQALAQVRSVGLEGRSCGDRRVDASQVVDEILRLLAPLEESARDQPGNAMVVGRELLFGAPGEHHDEVVALVAQLERAIAVLLGSTGASEDRARVTARLVVSGGVLELNRTRTGRAEADSMHARLRELVDVAVHGACPGPGARC